MNRNSNPGHIEMTNGPSFNLRTPWTVDPTEDDYAMADAREEAWIKGQITNRSLPFTYETIRSYVSRNFGVLTGSDAEVAAAIVRAPDATLYRLFWVATKIAEATR